MRALLLMLLASCATASAPDRVVIEWVEAGRPVEAPRAPVYECAAEDGSGRTVRVEYSGDPVRLSEGLADEPGGLWSCYRGHGDVEGSIRCGSAATPPNTIPVPGGTVLVPTPAEPVTCSTILGAETSDEYCERCPNACAVSPLGQIGATTGVQTLEWPPRPLTMGSAGR
jgi:hypothetical protein